MLKKQVELPSIISNQTNKLLGTAWSTCESVALDYKHKTLYYNDYRKGKGTESLEVTPIPLTPLTLMT